MWRWQNNTPKEYHEQHAESYLYSGFIVKEWVIYCTEAELIYFHIKTVTWRVRRKCDIRLNRKSRLPEDTLFYVDNAFGRKVKVYAYSPGTDTCVYIGRRNAPGTTWIHPFHVDNNSYLVNNQFLLTGHLHQFNHTDLQWRRVQTRGYRILRGVLVNCPKVDGSNVYFPFTRDRIHMNMAVLDLKSLQWSIGGMKGGLMFTTNSRKKHYLMELLTCESRKLHIQGRPFKNIRGEPYFLMGKFMVFPSLFVYKEGSKRFMKFLNEVLNTSTSLKDLATEAVLKNNIELRDLPQSIQKDIYLLFDPTRNTKVELPFYELRSLRS